MPPKVGILRSDRPSVRLSVRPSVSPSVSLSVCPSDYGGGRVCSVTYSCIEGIRNNFALLFTIGQRCVARQAKSSLSKVKVTNGVQTEFSWYLHIDSGSRFSGRKGLFVGYRPVI